MPHLLSEIGGDWMSMLLFLLRASYVDRGGVHHNSVSLQVRILHESNPLSWALTLELFIWYGPIHVHRS